MPRLATAHALAGFALACQLASPLHAQAVPTHPQEPLTAAEIARTTTVLRGTGKLDSTSAFVSIVLHEPPGAATARAERHAAVVAPQLAAVFDQHFFNFRSTSTIRATPSSR